MTDKILNRCITTSKRRTNDLGIGLIALGIGLIALGIGLIALGIGLIVLGIGLIALGVGLIALGIGLIALGVGLIALGGEILSPKLYQPSFFSCTTIGQPKKSFLDRLLMRE